MNVALFYTKMSNFLFCIYYLSLTYLVSAWFVLQEIVSKRKKPSGIRCQKGKVAIITGGGTGVGYATAQRFLSLEMTVVIVGVYKHQKEGLDELRKTAEGKVHFIECDLSSLKQVKRVAEEFNKLKLPLHILVNNAGVMFHPHVETPEGHEYHWVVNYLSHFLLTQILLPCLINSSSAEEPSRIVNLSSVLHYPASINFNDIEGRKCYSPEFAYGQSKLAMVLFASKLNKYFLEKNIPILANAVHPAVTFTSLYKNVWWSQKCSYLLKAILKTPVDGSQTVIHASLSSNVCKGGDYYENCQVTPPSAEAQSGVIQNRLWDSSLEQLVINDFL